MEADAGQERRQGNMRGAILEAAERLFAARGYSSVSIRDVASAANAHTGSVTYHFGNKIGLLRAIYDLHCGPINHRRHELLTEALRIRSREERLAAILRAYIVPAFASGADVAGGGGARFTRLRAVLSAEGSDEIREIKAEAFDKTNTRFVDAICRTVPVLSRIEVLWRTQFLLGAIYFTLINPERIGRLSEGEADGADHDAAIDHLVAATMYGLLGRKSLETAI